MFIIGFLFFFVTGLIVVISYQFMQSLQVDELLTLMEDAPGFLANIADEFALIFQDHTLYVWSQWHAKNMLQGGTVFAIVLGMGVISRETNRGTISYLVTKPFSKKTIYLMKGLTGVTTLFTVILCNTALLLLIARMAGMQIHGLRLVVGSIPVLIGLLPIYFTAMFFSNLLDDTVKAGLITGALWGLFSLLGFFSQTRAFSPFTYMRAWDYILQQQFPLLSVLILGSIGICIFYLGMRKFENRAF